MSTSFASTALVVPFEQLRMSDVESVGGKNASLGEMISQLTASGVRVPGGFATTAHAFREFLAHQGLRRAIERRLATLDSEDVRALAAVGQEIRHWIEATPLPSALEDAIRTHFAQLEGASPGASYAVRSSATAEDLPDASFAGQQETFLNVAGIDEVLRRMKRCLPASTTTVRSATGSTRAMPMPMWRCRRACSGWCAPTSALPV